MEVRKDGAWRTITTAEAYVGGSWRLLKYGEAYIDGAWRQIVSFAQPLSLAITPPSPGATYASSTLTTGTVTATPTGGVSPFTYAWTRLSMTGATNFVANSPSAASSTFTATGVAEGAIADTSFRCTVTDALGTVATATIDIFAQNTTGTTDGGA